MKEGKSFTIYEGSKDWGEEDKKGILEFANFMTKKKKR